MILNRIAIATLVFFGCMNLVNAGVFIQLATAPKDPQFVAWPGFVFYGLIGFACICLSIAIASNKSPLKF